MMKTRIALSLGFVMAVLPASVAAQSTSPVPGQLDMALIDQLCAAAAADEAELSACTTSVETALEQMLEEGSGEGKSLLEQAQDIVDDTTNLVGDALDEAREIDLQAALDDVVESAQDFEIDIDVDVQGAIDDAVAAFEGIELDDIDIQAALEGAVAEALETGEDLDLQGAFDEALAEVQAAIEEADLQGTADEALAEVQAAIEEADLEGTVDDTVVALEGSIGEAQAVVAEAQAWTRENSGVVCRGGSVSLGTTVGLAVFALTGVEWLGLQAFWATERFTNGVCGDIVE